MLRRLQKYDEISKLWFLMKFGVFVKIYELYQHILDQSKLFLYYYLLVSKGVTPAQETNYLQMEASASFIHVF